MDNTIATTATDDLDVATSAVKHAATILNQPTRPDIPDLYPVLGELVALVRAIRHFLDTLPPLSAYDPTEHYDSQGHDPRASLTKAERDLNDTTFALHSADTWLNGAWSHIGRIGKIPPF